MGAGWGWASGREMIVGRWWLSLPRIRRAYWGQGSPVVETSGVGQLAPPLIREHWSRARLAWERGHRWLGGPIGALIRPVGHCCSDHHNEESSCLSSHSGIPVTWFLYINVYVFLIWSNLYMIIKLLVYILKIKEICMWGICISMVDIHKTNFVKHH